MSTVVVSGAHLKELFMNGYRNLKRNRETVNSLNVFPVPDGDTGTNMTATFAGGFTAPESEDISEYMKAFSRGTLMSARGNSGVILSQFIRGFALGVEGKDRITASEFADAVKRGVEYAYKSVLKPVEGTMLTVLREAAEFVGSKKDDFVSFDECMIAFCDKMKNTLEKTPDMLPVLKEAEVIDSGGAGVLCIFEGVCMALAGEYISDDESEVETGKVSFSSLDPSSLFEYGYCTEFVLKLLDTKCDVSSVNIGVEFGKELEKLGDSVVCVNDEDMIKAHVHTFEPENVLAFARRFGEFITVKIENMSVQHNEIISKDHKKNSERVKFAVVAVASGDGIISYFKEIGANEVIDGGQTKNPSTEDFIEAFSRINAEHIIVLPNNSNIILTAQLARDIYKEADVRVIETKSVAEGYSALSMMDVFAQTVEDFEQSMTSCLNGVRTGYVTVATRNSRVGGVSVDAGDFIGLYSESILTSEDNKVSAAISLLHAVSDDDEIEVVTVFCGRDVSETEIDELRQRFEDEFPLVDVAFIKGGQSVYSFIISME